MTTYDILNNTKEIILDVGASGDQAYACIAHDVKKQIWIWKMNSPGRTCRSISKRYAYSEIISI